MHRRRIYDAFVGYRSLLTTARCATADLRDFSLDLIKHLIARTNN